MIITIESLQEQIKTLVAEREQHIANANFTNGAIQLAQKLLQDLTAEEVVDNSEKKK